MHAPCTQVKIISICLDFIVIALFWLIVFQFLRDFKLNEGSIDAWSFRIEHKTFIRCCVVNLRSFKIDIPERMSTHALLHRKSFQSLSRLNNGLYYFPFQWSRLTEQFV